MTDKKPNFRFHSPDYYLPWITGLLIAIWITQLILIQILGNHLKQQLTKTDTLLRHQADEQQANQVLDQYRSQIEQLTQAFPDETGVIQFVRLLKDQLAPYQNPQIDINNQPIQVSDQFAPLLPVSLTASTATPSAFTKLMDQITQNKYLFQPTSLEITTPNGFSHPGKLIYKANLYVSPDLLK